MKFRTTKINSKQHHKLFTNICKSENVRYTLMCQSLGESVLHVQHEHGKKHQSRAFLQCSSKWQMTLNHYTYIIKSHFMT